MAAADVICTAGSAANARSTACCRPVSFTKIARWSSANHGLDQVSFRPGQYVRNGVVPLQRLAQRPLGVLAKSESESELARLELLVQRVQDVGEHRVCRLRSVGRRREGTQSRPCRPPDEPDPPAARNAASMRANSPRD